MSDSMVIVLAIVAAGSGIYLLGHNLIDAYFRRKEKFVDTLQGKLKGETDGETK